MSAEIVDDDWGDEDLRAREDHYPEYREWLAYIEQSLPHGAPVLDLGCGCGVPATKILARNFDVLGVDLSDIQIETARRLVPNARFFLGDMTKIAFPEESLAGVVSFYAIIHLPVHAQRRLLRRIAGWLKPGGYFMATVGHKIWGAPGQLATDREEVQTGWSHAGRETYLKWLSEFGFYIHWHRFVHEGSGGQTLVCCSKVNRRAPAPRRRTIYNLTRNILNGGTKGLVFG